MTKHQERIYKAAAKDDFELMRALMEQRAAFPSSYRTVLKSVAMHRHEQAPSLTDA